MNFPKEKETRLRNWLESLSNQQEKCKNEISSLGKRLTDLKIELQTSELKLDILNDIDDERDRELVEKLYVNEINQEQDKLIQDIQSMDDEIVHCEDIIKAVNIIIKHSKIYD